MAVYGQPLMLAEWFRTYELDDAEYLDQTEVLVVDDCGTPPVQPRARARVLRVTKNVPWNQGEARNIAACEARGRVLLMLDPDMTIPAGELRRFVQVAEDLREGHVVRPRLRHGNGKLDATSPNVYLIHRIDFLKCGYDLCYSGHKGYGDVELSNLWNRLYKSDGDEGLIVDFHHGGKFADAQVQSISRDLAHNRKLHLARHSRCMKIGVKAFVKERSVLVKSEWEAVR